ncbi:hypothetical protein HYH02_011389 [Chlamydomonas schloesseri]|uniref:CAAX prenyl protease 2/Lysostaphin resistance protein A-like domain-containing protein n=1 Tax=Chlamydomonas schloesseri TaxID=2026947 RepID=A0A835T6K6_9CHLO|nr:hypothetical protein HYH02_011389 [Chlamydomonas schloesseri]|eukprot:KAG2437133.1 hypothetical protein HYH02_011389 [Chlamydomonas schloesseri]
MTRAVDERREAASEPQPSRPSPVGAAGAPASSVAATAIDAAGTAPAAPPPPALTPGVFINEVMAWSAALAVVGVAATVQTPQATALLSDDVIRSTALRHLGLEVLCCCLAAAVLFMGLRRSKPMAAGMFSFAAEPGALSTAALLAAVAYPLADPLLHQACLAAEQALGVSALLPDPGSGLAAQLAEARQAGDGLSLALHGAASCLVGPLWEETFWRGFFLASMTRVLPLPACVAASSTLFAALHLGPGNLLPIAGLSAACDLLYLRTGSLAAPLLFHAGWNAYELAGILVLGREAFV